MIHVVPISKPSVDLPSLFQVASTALGYSIAKSIDQNATLLSDDAKFISALASLSYYEKLSPLEHLHKADHELYFLYYTFAVYCDKDTARVVREWTKLDINSNFALDGDVLFVAGGSLATWKNAIENCCSERASFNLRLLFDKILLLFEKMGLDYVWFDFRKKSLPDKTFYLEDRR